MTEDLKVKLHEIGARQATLEARQEEVLLAVIRTGPQGQLTKVLTCLDRLEADGRADPEARRRVTLWAELEDALDELRAVKEGLPAGLFRRLWMCAREARERFQQDALDSYAVKQIAYARKAVINARARIGGTRPTMPAPR
jgi:hypothetical protein